MFKGFDLPLDYISINNELIEAFSKNINPKILKIPDWTEDIFLIEESAKDIEFIFLINTINFSYWPDKGEKKWDFTFKDKNYTGSFALFAALKNAILNDFPLFEPFYLKNISIDDLKIILAGTTEIPMFDERLKILREIGNNLLENEIKDFTTILKKADNSAINLILLLDKLFPSFRDRFIYKGQPCEFYKRAQLICAMLFGRYGGKKYGEFADIEKLVIFTDYRVPQTIRKLGLVNYNSVLSNKIENEIYIDSGSPEELEIRISSIQAAETLKEKINAKYPNLANALNLDYYFWKEGKKIAEPDYKFHKTRTIYY